MAMPHMPSNALVLDSVSKLYSESGGRRLLLASAFDLLRGRRRPPRRALDGVSFTVPRGATLGIIGANGSGKSTLLRVISGVTVPTTGTVVRQGRLVGLLELGAGFDDRLSTRDNIFLNGALIGMRRDMVTKSMDSILDFAELRDFADAPLHTFSSGMVVRLGFAVAMHAEADVLLFDEVLAVGDLAFQAKCFRAIERCRTEGKTIVFVSHDLYAVRNVSDSVLLLHKGRVEAQGSPPEVIQQYWSTVLCEDSLAILERGPLRVVFENGQLTLWHGGKPLTKGFAGYTSVRNFVRWHESDKATWSISSRSDTRIVAVGKYQGLAATQEWLVEIKPDNVLAWEVWMNVHQEVRFEREQASFMFCEAYDCFSAAGHSGSMGQFRRTVSDDWQEIYSIGSERGPVELSSSDPELPVIRFASAGPADTHLLRLVNSDDNFRGRLVQALRKPGSESKSPGRYLFFTGTLKIGDAT